MKSAKAPRGGSAHPAGFTLMEITLVLALMAVVAAMAVPIYRSTLTNERLRRVAESIAADWTRTRTQAIRTGETQVWICTLADGSYSSKAYSAGVSAGGLSGADVAGQVSASTGLAPTGAASATGRMGQTLPSGVSVSEALVSEADTVALMTQASDAGDGGMVTLFFYPDGSSSSARLTVLNERSRSITVVMNGLAGTVRVLQLREAQQ